MMFTLFGNPLVDTLPALLRAFFIMQISIEDNVKEFAKKLTRIQKKQIPFATSMALNNTAHKVQLALQGRAQVDFDRPTGTTINAFIYRKSTKNHLVATMSVKYFARDYIAREIYGGTQTGNRPVPVNAKVNAYGNLPKGFVKRIAASKTGFVGRPKGGKRAAGVWRRSNNNKKLTLLAAFEQTTQYQPRFRYHTTIRWNVRKIFPVEFAKSFQRAISSAR